MITRIVKMTFKEEACIQFESFFDEISPVISNMPGCLALKLWRDQQDSNIYFTYSIWDSEHDLNHYRYSDYFKQIWPATKAMFSAKAEAWSVHEIKTVK